MPGHQPRQELLEVLQQPLARSGLDLEDVEISAAGRRRLVRVLVDRDGGITLDEIADATQLVNSELDRHDVLGENPYTLEVTSPGIDRPLTLPRHWRRNVGRLVKVTTAAGHDVTGRIVEVTDDRTTLDVEGEPTVLPLAQVVTARVEVEFNRARSNEGG
ncbi:MAG: ribosome maturation factor RimP [Nocardioidaceae bacterium]